MREWFKVEAAAKGRGGGEILIYGIIGQSFWSESRDRYVPAKAFVQELEKLMAAGPGDVHIRINSPGGDVWDGTAIYNAILSHRNRCVCTVEGVAFSMASMIALAGRETRMYTTSQYMLHNPRGGAWGEEKDLLQAVEGLRTARTALSIAYQNKSGQSAEAIAEMMGRTTWMTAAQAKEYGFVDVLLGLKDAAAEASGLQMVALHDVEGWRAYYEGRGPAPVDNVAGGCLGREALVADGSAAGFDGGGDGAAETKKENGMKPSEIKELCPGASAEFILAQVEAAAGNETYGEVQVLKAWTAEQSKVLAASEAAKAEAEKVAAEALAKASAKGPEKAGGVPPLASGGTAAGEGEEDPVSAWDEAVEGRLKRGLTRAQAIRDVVLKNPALHKAYIAAHNAAHGRPAGRFAV